MSMIPVHFSSGPEVVLKLMAELGVTDPEMLGSFADNVNTNWASTDSDGRYHFVVLGTGVNAFMRALNGRPEA